MFRFTGSLIGYPFLAVIAVFHGLFAAVIAVFHGLLAVVVSCVKHIGWIVAYPVAAFTTARVFNRRYKPADSGSAYALAVGILIFLGFAFFMSSYQPPEWFTRYHLDWAALGLAATNAFSILYECGRVYWRHLNGVKDSDPEPDKPAPAVLPKAGDEPDTFLGMHDRIESFATITLEQVQQLYEEIVEMLKKGQIDLPEACSLRVMVDNGHRNPVEKEPELVQPPAPSGPAGDEVVILKS